MQCINAVWALPWDKFLEKQNHMSVTSTGIIPLLFAYWHSTGKLTGGPVLKIKMKTPYGEKPHLTILTLT